MSSSSQSSTIRIKLLLSVLSGQPIKIKNIRQDEEEPGLRDYEVNLLKLLDLITNGTRTDINETGTFLYFAPGLLTGGTHEFDCKTERSISYFLQSVMCLAPFAKQPMEITFKGVTNDPVDVSIDCIKFAGMPVIKRFIGSDDGLELRIEKRGAKPDGGGQVFYRSPTKMKLIPVNLTDPGKIKRVRGVCYAMRVAPAICNRMIETAKGFMLKYLPDVYIVSDHQKRENAGNSPAFGMTLVAETINGTFLCGEAVSLPRGSHELRDNPNVPEDIAKKAACNLLEEIYRGGCIDSSQQYLSFLFMVLNQKDISRVLSGVLSPFSIEFLRETRKVFETRFKVEPCGGDNKKELDINHKRALEEKEKAEQLRKKKLKRNLQLPQEKIDYEASRTELANEAEEKRKKEMKELEEKDASVKEYLRLGHEKLLMSCLGIGFTNIAKTYV